MDTQSTVNRLLKEYGLNDVNRLCVLQSSIINSLKLVFSKSYEELTLKNDVLVKHNQNLSSEIKRLERLLDFYDSELLKGANFNG